MFNSVQCKLNVNTSKNVSSIRSKLSSTLVQTLNTYIRFSHSKIVSLLKHPNIVPIVVYYVSNGTSILINNYKGINLKYMFSFIVDLMELFSQQAFGIFKYLNILYFWTWYPSIIECIYPDILYSGPISIIIRTNIKVKTIL